MSHLSTSEVGALETLWITVAVTYSRVEVRHDCYGVCKLLPCTMSGFDTIRMIVDRLTSIVLSKVLDIV